MSKSPVSLTCHRNTIESRRKRVLAKELTARVGSLIRERDIRAYAVVGIGADGGAYAFWDTGGILPLWAFADTMRAALRRDIEETDIADDWRPTLPMKGSDQ